MDRHKWMYEIGHAEEAYITGVQSFLKFADTNRLNNGDRTICCPCADCKNLQKYSDMSTIERHLITRGFVRKYTCWSRHGELHVDGGTSVPISGDFSNIADNAFLIKWMGTLVTMMKKTTQQLFEDSDQPFMLEAFPDMTSEDNGLPVSLYQAK
ncbi:ribonuclease H-like domain-containing protein [Tanacetum coccineum]